MRIPAEGAGRRPNGIRVPRSEPSPQHQSNFPDGRRPPRWPDVRHGDMPMPHVPPASLTRNPATPDLGGGTASPRRRSVTRPRRPLRLRPGTRRRPSPCAAHGPTLPPMANTHGNPHPTDGRQADMRPSLRRTLNSGPLLGRKCRAATEFAERRIRGGGDRPSADVARNAGSGPSAGQPAETRARGVGRRGPALSANGNSVAANCLRLPGFSAMQGGRRVGARGVGRRIIEDTGRYHLVP